MERAIRFEEYCPESLAEMPNFLKETYGLIVFFNEDEYDIGCKFKRAIGCPIDIKGLARIIKRSEHFTRRSVGILWKLGYIEYENGRFIPKIH